MSEIKEILDYFKRSNKNKLGFEQDKIITYKEAKLLLDYITNLREEINKLTSESTEWEERTYCWQDRAENLEIIIDKALEIVCCIEHNLDKYEEIGGDHLEYATNKVYELKDYLIEELKEGEDNND